MNRFLITFYDGTSEEVIAYSCYSCTVYTSNEEIKRISFYDNEGELIACYAGQAVKRYKKITSEEESR